MEERSSRGRTPSAMEERSSSGYGTVELDEVTRSAVSELDELVGRRSRPSALDAAPGEGRAHRRLPAAATAVGLVVVALAARSAWQHHGASVRAAGASATASVPRRAFRSSSSDAGLPRREGGALAVWCTVFGAQ